LFIYYIIKLLNSLDFDIRRIDSEKNLLWYNISISSCDVF